MSTSDEIIVDARRLLCPLPVIRTQDAVAKLPPEQLLKVICTDPGALQDIPAWARIHGHSVVHTETVEREYHITLRTAAKA
ncbi:MAG: sulfurtransferase TusA family protein [Thiofilum sp.]|uniref:sulfurtransferase TusA family protein n=1 Tax=Thiofilum sp. TaxID=2212733 RepID=UPI0025E39BCF|nr:sulfurtransferase TusA family protein [Thiofilum sp.]MBK8453133.1 sulfurtransferase TusA family protein [Thiofilum sp.]